MLANWDNPCVFASSPLLSWRDVSWSVLTRSWPVVSWPLVCCVFKWSAHMNTKHCGSSLKDLTLWFIAPSTLDELWVQGQFSWLKSHLLGWWWDRTVSEGVLSGNMVIFFFFSLWVLPHFSLKWNGDIPVEFKKKKRKAESTQSCLVWCWRCFGVCVIGNTPHVYLLPINSRVYISVVGFPAGDPVGPIVCLVSRLFPVCLVKVMLR